MKFEDEKVNFKSALLTMSLYFGNEISPSKISADEMKGQKYINRFLSPPLYCLEGTSDRLLAHVSCIAVVYLSGLLGWNGEKIPKNTITKAITETLYYKKSNAHRLVVLGQRLALKVRKDAQTHGNDREFIILLEQSTVKEAIFQLHNSIKQAMKNANKSLTLENLALLISGVESNMPKNKYLQIIDIINKEGQNIDTDSLLSILDIINKALAKK